MGLRINGSTSGYVELNAPAVAGSTSLTLPTLGFGKVLQAVMGSYSTITTISNTATFVDTGLTATITPSSSSSKILVMVSQPVTLSRSGSQTDLYAFSYKVLRGATAIFSSGENRFFVSGFAAYSGPTAGHIFSWNYLDSPATTSAITYKTQGATAPIAGVTMYANSGGSDTAQTSTLILIEIGP